MAESEADARRASAYARLPDHSHTRSHSAPLFHPDLTCFYLGYVAGFGKIFRGWHCAATGHWVDVISPTPIQCLADHLGYAGRFQKKIIAHVDRRIDQATSSRWRDAAPSKNLNFPLFVSLVRPSSSSFVGGTVDWPGRQSSCRVVPTVHWIHLWLP